MSPSNADRSFRHKTLFTSQIVKYRIYSCHTAILGHGSCARALHLLLYIKQPPPFSFMQLAPGRHSESCGMDFPLHNNPPGFVWGSSCRAVVCFLDLFLIVSEVKSTLIEHLVRVLIQCSDGYVMLRLLRLRSEGQSLAELS